MPYTGLRGDAALIALHMFVKDNQRSGLAAEARQQHTFITCGRVA
jgi:hypothetical protein